MPQPRVSSGLPSYPSGLTDAQANLAAPLYRAVNSLANSMSVLTGNVDYSPAEQASVNQLVKLLDAQTQVIFVQAAEPLVFGQLLTLSVAGGRIVAHVASALDLARPAHAVCNVPSIATGSNGEALFMRGRTRGISGTVFGAPYYLSSSGIAQITPPAATGVLNQVVGVGLGSEGFYLNIEPVAKRPVLIYRFSPTVIRILYADGTHTDV